MTSSDKVNAANAEWAMYIISSCSVGRKGMYNPATRQTVKWTDMATVVDKDEDSENTMHVLGINKNEERVHEDSQNGFIEIVNVGAGIEG
jgi:hypothetical protein